MATRIVFSRDIDLTIDQPAAEVSDALRQAGPGGLVSFSRAGGQGDVVVKPDLILYLEEVPDYGGSSGTVPKA